MRFCTGGILIVITKGREREEGSIVFAAIGASVDIRFRFGR